MVMGGYNLSPPISISANHGVSFFLIFFGLLRGAPVSCLLAVFFLIRFIFYFLLALVRPREKTEEKKNELFCRKKGASIFIYLV
jgi:hypothetical protein